MSELHVYDFDGTLFRSPHEPAVWDGDWWNDDRSLLPPCVPDTPGSEWWISSTVSDAKRSISDQDVYAIMLTGRSAQSGLRYRIPELLKQKGLNFDEVHLAPPSGMLAWKKRLIVRALRNYPFIDTVRIWDDRTSHLPEFARAAEKVGIASENIHTELVRSRSRAPECEAEDFVQAPSKLDKKPSYMGLFLDGRSKASLVRAFPYAHNKLKADHVTLAYFGSSEAEEWMRHIGEKGAVKVVGYAEDLKGQAVRVSPVGSLPHAPGKDLHVTLSLAEGVAPAYSKEMLGKLNLEPVNGPILTGIIDVYPRSLAPARVASRYLKVLAGRSAMPRQGGEEVL